MKDIDYSLILANKTQYFAYYSVLYELQTNDRKIINLKGFKFKSINETLLWQQELNRMPSKVSNTFYASLEEIDLIKKEFEDRTANDNLKGFFYSLTLRCTILGLILSYCDTRLIYGSLKKIDNDLYLFFTKCNQLSSQFINEFQIDNYQLLTSSLNSSSDVFTSSVYLKEMIDHGEKLFASIENIYKNKIMDKFFSPFEYVKQSLIGIIRESTEEDVLDVLVFKDNLLYVTEYGESPMLSSIFINKNRLSDTLLLESLRFVSKLEKENVNNEKINIFREAFASYVFLNNEKNNQELEKSILQSQNIIFLRKKFWLENNKRRISDQSYDIRQIIRELFNEFKQDIVSKNQEEAYYLFYANMHNKVQEILLEKSCVYPHDFTEEEIVYLSEELSKIMEDIIIEK